MSYGLEVWGNSGGARVFSESWIFKYHSTHTVTVPANSSRLISVAGFNPNTWGVQQDVIDHPNATPVNAAGITYESNGVRVYAGRGSVTVRVTMFKG